MKQQFDGLSILNRNSTKKAYPLTLFGLTSTTRIGEPATKFEGENYDHYFSVLSSTSPEYKENGFNVELNDLASRGCLVAANKNLIEELATVVGMEYLHKTSVKRGSSGVPTLDLLGMAIERLLQNHCPIKSIILDDTDIPSYHFTTVYHPEYTLGWMRMLVKLYLHSSSIFYMKGKEAEGMVHIHSVVFSESPKYEEHEYQLLLNYYKGQTLQDFDNTNASIQDVVNKHLQNILSIHRRTIRLHWKHHTSGQKYRILGFAPYHDNPTEMCIIYKNINNHEIYVRKADDFLRSMSYVKAKR